MINFNDSILKKLVVHHIGNKHKEGVVKISDNLITVSEGINDLLMHYFLNPFKTDVYFNFHHEENIESNMVFNIVNNIFENKENFLSESENLAHHLFEQSIHPKIKSGEFYIAYIENCIIEDEVVDAIGLFKSESKEQYLKIFQQNSNFEINSDLGVNINKLDKGCLVFNTEKEFGYKICIVDSHSKKQEAQYWKDDFLMLKERKDDFYQTNNYLNVCKGFVKNVYNESNNIEKTDQIDMMNKSIGYFKDNDSFDEENFKSEVINEPEVIDAFNQYKDHYEQENDVDLQSDFKISDTALKKNQRKFKSILKLDKNFHIYIHGDRQRIMKGFDEEKELSYYKIYYENEV